MNELEKDIEFNRVKNEMDKTREKVREIQEKKKVEDETLEYYVDKVLDDKATSVEEIKLEIFYEVLFLTSIDNGFRSQRELKKKIENKTKMLLDSDGANIRTRAKESELIKWAKNLVEARHNS